ncbi:hypothetical protein L1887_04045 [Cichorium endivia]|nr:hypothetical protein L1887_04045 [Cichorium endivia]
MEKKKRDNAVEFYQKPTSATFVLTPFFMVFLLSIHQCQSHSHPSVFLSLNQLNPFEVDGMKRGTRL